MTSEASHEHYDEMPELDISPDLLNSNLGSGEIEEISYRMTHSCELLCGFNVAFGEYMEEFDRLNPDIYVLTAHSAVPVADSIRGWYEATGGTQPELTYIHANRDLAKEALLTLDQHRRIEEDTKRLAEEYANMRAVIIDQFVYSGSTLGLASRMVENAGIAKIGSTSEARWYNHAFGKVDLQNMTSEHASFMRRVGREALHYSSEDRLLGAVYFCDSEDQVQLP